MRVMSLDCEYNQPSRKTIQIGAAVYDAGTGKLIDRFEIFVDPGEPINPEIVELTGVTDQDVRGAVKIEEAWEMLREFHARNKVFCNPLVWGSGYRNDSQTLHEESKDPKDNFMGFRVLDVKSIFQSVQLHRNHKVRGGLVATCEKLKIGFEGKAHSALADAMNTFRVWYYLVTRMGDFK